MGEGQLIPNPIAQGPVLDKHKKSATSPRPTVESLGWLHNLTEALVSNLCPTGSLRQLREGPGVFTLCSAGIRSEHDTSLCPRLSQSSRVMVSLMPLLWATHRLPLSSCLCREHKLPSPSPPPLCSGSAPTMVSLGALVMTKDSLLCLSSPPRSAQGLWHALETPACWQGKTLLQAHPHPRVCGLLSPSAPNALSAAVCMDVPRVVQALAQMSPPARNPLPTALPFLKQQTPGGQGLVSYLPLDYPLGPGLCLVHSSAW